MENKQTPLGFAQTKLPWLIAAGGLVIYLVTLNIWINVRSLPIVAKVTGWDWTPPLQLPLFYLLTYPFRILPETIQPITLNVMTAICGALTLWLLARSVSLLPHDRTHEQRIRERSEFSLLSTKWNWIPPLLAAAVLGLQLTFWEHSTAVTGEMLDLLIFAYCIRCLLEYRIDQRESWLTRLAFVYGLGVTNNWALIGFFPLFLGALIWIKGISFFRGAFLMKMAAAGLIGLTVYLFLPILWAIKQPETGFWDVLKVVVGSQKGFLAAKTLRQPALVLALTSVLPVIVMGIRWPSSFGDTSAFGAMLTNILFRVVHLTFLGACLWMAFDQAFSPRRVGLGLPFLTFYYLGALAIGYYSAYALLVFTKPPRKTSPGTSPIMELLNPVIRAAVFAAAVAAPIALIYKNLPPVRASNGKLLREFAALSSDLLPKGRTYVISDDAFQTVILRAYLNKEGRGNDYILINSGGLESASYHHELGKVHGERWPKIPQVEAGSALNPAYVQHFVSELVRSNQVVYLHPSFGYYFEGVYQVPQGVVYNLKNYEEENILRPKPAPELIQENNAFWSKTEEFLNRLKAKRKLDSVDPAYIARFYSRALNSWGVDVQRAANAQQARPYFAKAVELNTNNIPANINLDFNQKLTSGQAIEIPQDVNLEEKLGGYRTWREVLRDNGPFDEPVFALALGRTLLEQGLFRQGLEYVYRILDFQPTNYTAQVLAIRGLIYGGWPSKGLEQLDKTRQSLQLETAQAVELINLESIAYFNTTNRQKAEEVLLEAEKTYPNHPVLLSAKFELYEASGDTAKALEALDQQLKTSSTNFMTQLRKAEMLFTMERFEEADQLLSEVIKANPSLLPAILYRAFVAMETKNFDSAKDLVAQALRIDPENQQALIYQAIIQMENKNYEGAISTLNYILDEDKDNFAALRNRAIVNLRAEKLEDARKDYQRLKELAPKSFAVYYGLANVADKSKNYKEAIKNYELYLRYFDASEITDHKELREERREVEARLAELKAQQK